MDTLTRYTTRPHRPTVAAMETVYLSTTDSPAGPLHLAVTAMGEVAGISFGATSTLEELATVLARSMRPVRDDAACRPLAEQIDEYARHQRREFDLPLRYTGSEWELRVWNALRMIPYGETRSYGQIATQLGKPSMARAVGWANHVNPIPLLIPCHRVIGAHGNLTGFGGGIDAKIRLLAHEGAMLPGFA